MTPTEEREDQVAAGEQHSEQHRIWPRARHWAGFAAGVGWVGLPAHFLVIIKLLPWGSCYDRRAPLYFYGGYLLGHHVVGSLRSA